MTKLEELTALLVNETNDFKIGLEKLEKINAQLAETKIKMDLSEYKAVLESHHHRMASYMKAIDSFESRFGKKIKQAKIYPKWAVVVFVFSLIFGIGGVAFVIIYCNVM